MLAIRHVGRTLADLVLYAVRSGRWWLPVLVVVIIAAVVVASTANVVVPTAMYTLF